MIFFFPEQNIRFSYKDGEIWSLKYVPTMDDLKL